MHQYTATIWAVLSYPQLLVDIRHVLIRDADLIMVYASIIGFPFFVDSAWTALSTNATAT
jgi:hypothetical protein